MAADETLPEHVQRNRTAWDAYATDDAAGGQRAWASSEPLWGVFGVPESELGVFPTDVGGLDVVELGCGTAYVSAWLARRGGRPVGIDNSAAQLATARELQATFELTFPLHQGNAEKTGLPDHSFDLAISEYGASTWCDPYVWIPEAARLLRPGGELIFLVNGTILMLCAPDDEAPATDRLLRDYFGLHRVEWAADDPPSVEFSPRVRRLDPAAAPSRLRGRGPDRGPATDLGHDPPSVRDRRVGPALAVRGDLEGPQTLVRVSEDAHARGGVGPVTRLIQARAPALPGNAKGADARRLSRG